MRATLLAALLVGSALPAMATTRSTQPLIEISGYYVRLDGSPTVTSGVIFRDGSFDRTEVSVDRTAGPFFVGTNVTHATRGGHPPLTAILNAISDAHAQSQKDCLWGGADGGEANEEFAISSFDKHGKPNSFHLYATATGLPSCDEPLRLLVDFLLLYLGSPQPHSARINLPSLSSIQPLCLPQP